MSHLANIAWDIILIKYSFYILSFLLLLLSEKTVTSAMKIIEDETCINFKPKKEREKNFVEFVHGGG